MGQGTKSSFCLEHPQKLEPKPLMARQAGGLHSTCQMVPQMVRCQLLMDCFIPMIWSGIISVGSLNACKSFSIHDIHLLCTHVCLSNGVLSRITRIAESTSFCGGDVGSLKAQQGVHNYIRKCTGVCYILFNIFLHLTKLIGPIFRYFNKGQQLHTI